MKSARIFQYLASDAMWQEDKYALQKVEKLFEAEIFWHEQKNWYLHTLTLELIKLMLKCQV